MSGDIAAAVVAWDFVEYMFETLSFELLESNELPHAEGNKEKKCVRISNISPPFQKVQ